jgi:hypothetical protein
MTGMNGLSLQHAFTIHGNVAAPISFGETYLGNSEFLPITGGYFDGPKLRGEVVPGGGDWKVLRPDGDTHIYAKYALKTNDSVYINILNEGVGRTVPLKDKEQEEEEEKENGQVYDGDGLPTIRTTPVFEVDVHSKHAWLNDWIFVADLKAINSTLVDVIVYEVF